MSARWNDHVDADRQNWQLVHALTLFSLDLIWPLATYFEVEERTLSSIQAELRRVLDLPFQNKLTDAQCWNIHAAPLMIALNKPVKEFVESFYDRVLRYSYEDAVALDDWDIVLIRLARTDTLWISLGLPPRSSEVLRNTFRATIEADDIQARVDAALAKPLSEWDRRVAVLRIFPPLEEDGYFGISDFRIRAYAKVVRTQSFWRTMAQTLGAEGMRELRVRAQAYLETQEDIASVFGQLADPWMLAHPELTQPLSSRESPP